MICTHISIRSQECNANNNNDDNNNDNNNNDNTIFI